MIYGKMVGSKDGSEHLWFDVLKDNTLYNHTLSGQKFTATHKYPQRSETI